MKQFDPTKPCRTRDGRKVRIICTDLKRLSGKPILALVADGAGYEYIYNYCLDGMCCNIPSGDDLFNIPEKHEIMIYFYHEDNDVNKGIYGSSVDCSFDYGGVIAKKTVTFEEGEGL